MQKLRKKNNLQHNVRVHVYVSCISVEFSTTQLFVSTHAETQRPEREVRVQDLQPPLQDEELPGLPHALTYRSASEVSVVKKRVYLPVR